MTVTHTRNFRCDDNLWTAAKEAAAVEGRTVTDVLIAALRRLVVVERRPEASLVCTHCGWVWNPANTSCEEHAWVAADAVGL